MITITIALTHLIGNMAVLEWVEQHGCPMSELTKVIANQDEIAQEADEIFLDPILDYITDCGVV